MAPNSTWSPTARDPARTCPPHVAPPHVVPPARGPVATSHWELPAESRVRPTSPPRPRVPSLLTLRASSLTSALQPPGASRRQVRPAPQRVVTKQDVPGGLGGGGGTGGRGQGTGGRGSAGGGKTERGGLGKGVKGGEGGGRGRRGRGGGRRKGGKGSGHGGGCGGGRGPHTLPTPHGDPPLSSLSSPLTEPVYTSNQRRRPSWESWPWAGVSLANTGSCL